MAILIQKWNLGMWLKKQVEIHSIVGAKGRDESCVSL